MKKNTLSDMVDKMAEDVAIVHQIPFACDRIDNITEPEISPPLEIVTDPSLFLQFDEKSHFQTKTQQRRFVATLEKVCI